MNAAKTNHSLIALAAIGLWLAWIVTQEPTPRHNSRRAPLMSPSAMDTEGAAARPEKAMLPPLPKMSTDPPLLQPAAPREFGGSLGGLGGGIINDKYYDSYEKPSKRGKPSARKERYSELFAPEPAAMDTFSPL